MQVQHRGPMKLCSIKDCNGEHYCKGLCRSHYNKQWRQDNYKECRAYDKQYKQEHKTKTKDNNKRYAATDVGRFNKAKSKAKTRGLEFDLDYEIFIDISSRPCFYCNDQLCGKKDFQGAHLDRIDNSMGYTMDNVVSCGLICNQIRMSNLTVAETKDAVEGILLGRKRRQNTWYVYMIQSSKDNTIYTGITLDVEARLKTHNEGRGARYTKGRGPFILLKSFETSSKSEALKLEYQIKQLSKEEKLNYVQKEKEV